MLGCVYMYRQILDKLGFLYVVYLVRGGWITEGVVFALFVSVDTH